MARLQNNKRYHEKDCNESFKEINYFEQSGYLSEKKRVEDVKKMLVISARKNKLFDILHKKVSEPEVDYGRKKGPNFQLFDGHFNLAKLKMKKSSSINEFKE